MRVCFTFWHALCTFCVSAVCVKIDEQMKECAADNLSHALCTFRVCVFEMSTV